jgi:uncharacterized protein (TIGR00369 family)
MSRLDERDKKLSQAMGLKGGFPPFVELLGLNFEPTEGDGIAVSVAMRDDLTIGPGGPLHGGVISAIMDVIGGCVIVWGLKREIKGQPLEEQAKRLSRVSTIDLRIDYLRPGRGKVFTATGSVMRTGRKVAVARMELRNEEQTLIAVGTGTYSVG